MLIHQPHGQLGGQAVDIEIRAKEILRHRTLLEEILARHTGQTVETIAKDADRDRIMTAEEAKAWWPFNRSFGREGLPVDEQQVGETVEVLRNQLEAVTDERDEARRTARDALDEAKRLRDELALQSK